MGVGHIKLYIRVIEELHEKELFECWLFSLFEEMILLLIET